MKWSVVLICSILCLKSAFAQDRIRVLLILAHYDDETIAASILSRLKDKNAIVEAIYLTKGEGGSDIRNPTLPSKNPIEESLRKTNLVAQREKEIAKASKILNISKVYQVDAGDVSLRIPEPGYPNPAGRPTTSGKKFMEAGIWNMDEIELKIKNIVKTNSIRPDYILTLSDDINVVHAHHQAANYITNKLNQEGVFGNQVKGVYGMIESQWYDMKLMPYKSSALYYDVNAKRASSSERQIDNAIKAYKAHVSQAASTATLSEFEKIPEVLYGLNNPRTGNAYDLQGFSKVLDNSTVRSFSGQKEWIKFHQTSKSWKLSCSPLFYLLRRI